MRETFSRQERQARKVVSGAGVLDNGVVE